jgi:toxin ParE1/3/4
MKPVIPRATARQDVDEAVDHYTDAAGADVALRFVDALQQAFHAISLRPGVGSQAAEKVAAILQRLY